MKKIALLSILGLSINMAIASEVVQIQGTKYVKYSDAEVQTFIVKMNSVKPEMTVDQVVSILGKPVREQAISSSQRILVYPLSIMISFYATQTGSWRVATPTRYTNPTCQREDGVPQQTALGNEVVEYPAINCIPTKFAAKPKAARSPENTETGRWVALPNADGRSRDKFFYDPKLVADNRSQKTVTTLTSFSSRQDDSARTGYLSSVSQIVLWCANGKFGVKSIQKFDDAMGKGREVSNSKLDGEPYMSIRDSYLADAVAKKLCASPEPLSLRAALADEKAITCRYNESENTCSDVDGQSDWHGSPQEFVVKAGYAKILDQKAFDEPGSSATYLKLTVRN